MNYKLIKHRGMHDGIIKENTYDALMKALKSPQYVGVEFDIRETKDHYFILNHDALIDGHLISNSNYPELPKYISKLEDILKIKTTKILLIEIKNITSISKFCHLLNKYGHQNIYVMSFGNNLIKQIDQDKRKYKIGILNYVLNTSDYYQKLDFVVILNSLINENILKLLKDKEIFAYGLLEKYEYPNVFYITDN